MTSFAISDGVRDAAGLWTSRRAKALLDYTKSIGETITAAEFFNEPSFAAIGGAPKGYNAEDYARDFDVFRSFAKAAAPNMLIVGPGSVGEGITLMPGSLLPTSDLLAASPRPQFDVFSYHSYAAASQRCTPEGAAGTSADAALSEAWLSRPEQIYAFYVVFATASNQISRSGSLRRPMQPAEAIPGLQHFSIVSATSTSWGVWPNTVSKQYSTTPLPPVTMASSTRAPSCLALIIGLRFCGVALWERQYWMQESRLHAFTYTRNACAANLGEWRCLRSIWTNQIRNPLTFRCLLNASR